MGRGGHPHSGPAPDPNALRRDRPSDQAGWVTLPAAGRSGPPPDWPLTHGTRRELDLWAAEWRRPQAIMWEANGQEIEVAIYVRTLRQSEQPSSPISMRTLLRQQQEALGVSLPGLARLRWRIESATAAARPAAPGRPSPTQSSGSARDRLKVVGGNG